MNTASVILAAGFGTRMKSSMPKVMHPILGRPLVGWAVDAATAATGTAPVVVVGYAREQVIEYLGDSACYAVQDEQLGTGHAVQQVASVLQGQVDAVLVTYGDMPLLQATTLKALVDRFAQAADEQDAAIAMLTITRDDPQGFGRIVRDGQGNIAAIVEEADCTPEQRRITELNPGVYCFDADWLWATLPQIPMSAKGEYYLTDLVGLAVDQGRRVVSMPAPLDDVYGINTRVHLAEATATMRRRILEQHMLAGVTILDPAATWVDAEVEIGADTTLWPGTILQGQTRIGAHATIGPNTQIVASTVGDHTLIKQSVIEHAQVDNYCEIGPFCHLRKGAHLADGVHMGNFGEVKNSTLGPGSKMGHFSYMGDAQVGANVNIGAGTITCNYDGAKKHQTVIEDGAFIGSDTLLVAPVHIGRGAKTGAGAVVTRDVGPNALAYGVPARTQTRPEQSSTDEGTTKE